jgi:hypothetical protein
MTTNCEQRLEDLRSTATRILDEDLASLSRMSDRIRIEKYNDIKSSEEEFVWGDFRDECGQIRTSGEFDSIRSELRLARLLIAASFHKDGAVPDPLGDDFADAALDAAVDFERYKQFDVLSEEQISRRIRDMDGEVYELAKNYTDSQIANMDELIDNPSVQQDLIDVLSDQYDDRLEKVRQGFFTYVEVHGIGGTVEAIEEAIEAVSDAQDVQRTVEEDLRSEIEALSEQLDRGFERQRRNVEQEIQSVEREIATSDPDTEAIRRELERLDVGGVADDYRETVAELEDTIERTESLEADLASEIEKLQTAKAESADADESAIADEVATIVDDELGDLEAQRERIQMEVRRLQNERESIEAARERLDERQTDLSDRVDEIETSVGDGGIDGESVVTPTMARLLELDYVGRFETSIRDASSIRLPDETFEVPEDYWEQRSERRNQRPRLGSMLDDGQDPERFPVNRSARYEITSSRFLGLSRETETVIEAAVFSHLDAHATNGFDGAPADLDDLLTYVNQSVYEAESEDMRVLLGIASPTGWTDSVRERIASEGISRTRFSRHVSIVLVDLQDSSLVYDESDPVARENSALFELPLADDRVEACVDDIEDRFENVGFASDMIALGELVSDGGYDPHIVKRAFGRFSDQPGYSQQYIDDQLVLSEK